MEIIRNHIKTEYFSYALLDEYLGGMKFCVFDIETLGLNPSVSPAVLFGFLEPERDNSAEITQYFLNDPSEERDTLDLVSEKLNTYDYIITYNGKHFDIPYIERRYKLLNRIPLMLSPYNLDLYLILYGHSPLKQKIMSLKQKNIERYMGIGGERDDEISGKESVELYYHYLLEENLQLKEQLKHRILLHNHDDVLQLYRILPVLKQADIHKAFNKLGFPVRRGTEPSSDSSVSPCLSMFPSGSGFSDTFNFPDVNIADIKLNSKNLSISGKYLGSPVNYIGYSSFERLYNIVLTTGNLFEIKIPVHKEKGSIFVNLNDYFCNSEAFAKYGAYVNDFLILSENGDINYRELNTFVRHMLLTVKKTDSF